MTKISKSLCVFVLVACLAFMGVAAVTRIGGANWHIERDQLTGDYTFETTLGETTTYAVKSRQTDQQLTASPKSLAATVIAARKDLVEVQKKKIEALQTETTTFKTQHQMWATLTAADEAAMTVRCDQLASELATLNQQIDGAAKQNIAKVEKTQNTLRSNEARREEVYRLLAQLDEIRTDRFQINEQQKRLRDLLIRKQGVVSRLKRRQVQLVRSGARGQYEDDPTAAPAATPKTTQP
jgi:chromosome segregation ATPase